MNMVAVVTGGSQGAGKGIAIAPATSRALTARGARGPGHDRGRPLSLKKKSVSHQVPKARDRRYRDAR